MNPVSQVPDRDQHPPAARSEQPLLALLGILGPFFLIATLAALVLTCLQASEHGWRTFGGGELFFVTLAQELAQAWRVLLLAALPVVVGLGFGRWMGRMRVLWAAAWMVAALPLVCGVWRDWRVFRHRDGWDVPQILWQRERLLPLLLVAGAAFAAALLGTLWLRRRSALERSSVRNLGVELERDGSLAWPRVRVALGAVALLLWGVAAALAQLGGDGGRVLHPVLYVTWDSTRADHVSAYGYERLTTPRLDALAAEGLLFERAYSQHNWTRPAYASIFSSKPQWGRAELGLDRFHWTLAEQLKAAGYRTRALIQNPNIAGYFGFAQGFDCFVEYREHVDEISARAATWLAELARDYAEGGEPFFLFVHMNEPHWPYRRSVTLDSGFTDEREPPIDEDLIDALMRRQFPGDGMGGVDERGIEYLFAGYDAEILAADQGLGVLLDTLQASGVADETLVVFNSDHGDEFAERGKFGHGHANVYPELTRVPFVMRFPTALIEQTPSSALSGARYTDPVESIDLFPTVLGALGLSPPPMLEGRDLFTRITRSAPAEPQQSFLARSYNNQRLALRSAQHALHYNTEIDTQRFFDLDVDLIEFDSISAAHAGPWSTEFTLAAEAWEQNQMKRSRGEMEAGELDEDLAEELRRLGYL